MRLTILFQLYLIIFVFLQANLLYSQDFGNNTNDLLYFYNSIDRSYDRIVNRYGKPHGTETNSDGIQLIWYEKNYNLLTFALSNKLSFLGFYIYSPNDKILHDVKDNFATKTLYSIWIGKYKAKKNLKLVEKLKNGNSYIERYIFFRNEDGIELVCDLYRNDLGNLSFQILARFRDDS